MKKDVAASAAETVAPKSPNFPRQTRVCSGRGYTPSVGKR